MKTKRNPLWRRLALLGAASLLGLNLNAADKAAWLGVSVGNVAEAVRHQLKLPRGAGLTVQNVANESPAAKARLERHDVLQKVDDQWLFNADQLTRLIRSYEPGDSVELTVLRGGNSESLTATLVEHEVADAVVWDPFAGAGQHGGFGMMGGGGGMGEMYGSGMGAGMDQPSRVEQQLKAIRGLSTGWAVEDQPTAFLGVELRTLDETLLEQLDRSREDGGVLIVGVIDDSPAAKAGLEKHDLIIELDGKKVANSRQFADIIGRWKPGDRVTLKLLREGKPTEVQVELGKREPADARQLKQLRQQYMVAPKVEVQTLPNQSGSVIIMQDQNSMSGFGGDGGMMGGGGFLGGAGGGFGGGGTGGAYGASSFGGSAGVSTQEMGTSRIRAGTIVTRDQTGEITVRQENENRHVTVKDAEGHVLFDGEVNSDADREALSEKVRKQLEKVEHLLQKNLTLPGVPPVQRQLRFLDEDTRPGPGFIRHEEVDILMPSEEVGV